MNTHASTSEEAAEQLWKGGLHRFEKHFPSWKMAAPDFLASAVVFIMVNGTKSFRVRVENSGTGGAGYTIGPNLQVRVVEEHGAGEVAEAFAQAILRIDKAGRAKSLPETAVRPTERGTGKEQGQNQGRDDVWRELFIADACNLRCTFCCESVRINRSSMMSWPKLEETLRNYARDGVNVVQFMGGEPSIHPNFIDALRLSRALGMRNYAITNLLRWTKRSFAEEVGPLLDELMISIHAIGEEAGERVTGRKYWWSQFQEAVKNAADTLTCPVYGATVLSKQSAANLEGVAEILVGLGATKWVMGNSVPIAEAPLNSLEINLGLSEQLEQMDRFEKIHRWTADHGCEMVFFCMPDCVLSEKLWPASHDRMLSDQDLLGTASAGEDVNFWSRTDFQKEEVRNVALGRRYADKCSNCSRHGTCGGYFDEYLQSVGDEELSPLRP
jgi:MoaA/NifB/PqqE/SkfB family radical SAM enzyme